jgi:Ran GTPase-activating protein (RanGAP) involved in mRNA processing and transport
VFLDTLLYYLDESDQNLTGLNLNHNFLNDNHAIKIINKLKETKNRTLTKLKLGRNGLTDEVAFALKELFDPMNRVDPKIEVLDLSWNKIYMPGGVAIADILKKDPLIRVLDLSYNCLSKQPPHAQKNQLNEIRKALGVHVPAKDLVTGFEQALGIRWCQAFMLNTKLLHLDLSHNKINYEDTDEMSVGLKENQTLYGIHYAGNMGRIDSLGFMHAIKS